MNEILDHPIQQGSDRLSNQGYDIVFDHVGFAYNTGETVLKDVSFTAKQGRGYGSGGPVRRRKNNRIPAGCKVLGY